MIRVRLGLGAGGDQTPVHSDSLEGESVIADKGAKIVAVGAKNGDGRTTCTAVLYSSSVPSLPPPLPEVTFKATSGVRIAEILSKDVAEKKRASRGPPTFFFTSSGKTTMDTTPNIFSALKKRLGPIQKVLHRQMMGEWTAPLYDSYEVLKSFISGHIQDFFDA